MKKLCAALAIVLVAASPSLAASVVNMDSESRTIVVTEGGSQGEITVGPGETVDFCPSGCFVTFPGGDREALTGGEAIEISGGVAHIR
jgi:hypothetical protein